MLVVVPDLQAESLEQIPLHYRMAEELLPILQPLVPPGSVVTGTGNVLFVRADATTLRQVRDAVASLDRAPRQLLITVGQATAAQGIGDVTLALEHVDAADAHQAKIADEFRADAARTHDRDGQACQWLSAVRFGWHLQLLCRTSLRRVNALRQP